MNNKLKKSSILIYVISCISLFFNQGIIAVAVNLVFSIILFILYKRENLIKESLITRIGDKSYVLYLIHQNIGYILLLKLYSFNSNIFYNVGLTCIIIYLLCILVEKINNYCLNLKGEVYDKFKSRFKKMSRT